MRTSPDYTVRESRHAGIRRRADDVGAREVVVYIEPAGHAGPAAT